VLDRDLHMIEPRIGKLAEPLIRDADTGGNEIGVEAGVARRCHDVDEIATRRRLAAREVDLQHAEPGGLAKHPRPGGSVEFAFPVCPSGEDRRKGDPGGGSEGGVGGGGGGGGGAAAAAGRCRPHVHWGDRRWSWHHSSKSFLSASPRSSVATSASTRSRGAAN